MSEPDFPTSCSFNHEIMTNNNNNNQHHHFDAAAPSSSSSAPVMTPATRTLLAAVRELCRALPCSVDAAAVSGSMALMLHAVAHDLPLAHSLSEEQAREWGLFLSEARPDSEEPEVFSEPGLFLLKPDRSIHFEVIQSAPFTRPDLDQLLEGIDIIAEKDYPARGTLT